MTKLIKDPFAREHTCHFRDFWQNPSLDNARKYLKFAFDNEDVLDPLFIGFSLVQSGPRNKKYFFRGTSPLEEDFLHRRKLWDFMEDIPAEKDPRAVCRELIFSLFDKVYEA